MGVCMCVYIYIHTSSSNLDIRLHGVRGGLERRARPLALGVIEGDLVEVTVLIARARVEHTVAVDDAPFDVFLCVCVIFFVCVCV